LNIIKYFNKFNNYLSRVIWYVQHINRLRNIYRLCSYTVWPFMTCIHLANEIKIFLIIIDHKRHLAMCIVTPKQYRYNVRYKYLSPEWQQSSWAHSMSHDIQNVSFLHYICYLGVPNLDIIAHVNKREGHQYSWFILLLHTKDVYRDIICMVASYRQHWIISTHTNYLYKKNTHFISKN
jgi:hypothetical protein